MACPLGSALSAPQDAHKASGVQKWPPPRLRGNLPRARRTRVALAPKALARSGRTGSPRPDSLFTPPGITVTFVASYRFAPPWAQTRAAVQHDKLCRQQRRCPSRQPWSCCCVAPMHRLDRTPPANTAPKNSRSPSPRFGPPRPAHTPVRRGSLERRSVPCGI
jgi:hypothetical protein